MSILAENVKLYKAENMTDTPAGGGIMSSSVVPCGAMNNLFPNISRIDRLNGRIQLRKVFVHIDSLNQDIYAGAHLITKEIPTDENVSIIMFDATSTGDHRPDLVSVIENYYTPTNFTGTAFLEFATGAGERQLVFKIADIQRHMITENQGTWENPIYRSYWMPSSIFNISRTCDIKVYDTIHFHEALHPENDEFLQVNKVEDITEWILYETNNQHFITYRIVYLMHPTTKPHSQGVIPKKTFKNNSFRCHGVIKLSEAAAIDDNIIKVNTTETRLVPVVDMIAQVENTKLIPSSTIIDGLLVGPTGEQWTINGIKQAFYTNYRAVTTGQRAYTMQLTNAPIKSGLAGSVTIYARLGGKWIACTDDGLGAITGDAGTGGVTYSSGMVTLNLSSAPDPGSVLIAVYQAEMSQDQITDVVVGPPGALPITLTFPNTNIIPSSLLLAFEYDSYQYQMRDDGDGHLIRDSLKLGTAFSSGDWIEHDVSSDGAPLFGIKTFNGVFFATFGKATFSAGYPIYSSTDGMNYTMDSNGILNTQNARNNFCLACNINTGTMVTAGSLVTYLKYRNGLSGNWLTPATPPPASEAADVGFGFGKFFLIVVGSQNVYTSLDGSIWTDEGAILPITVTAETVIASGVDDTGAEMVVVAHATGIARTLNGTSWTGCLGALGDGVRSISCNPASKTWYMVGDECRMMISKNGYLWTSVSDRLPALWKTNAVRLSQITNNGITGWIIAGGQASTSGGAFCQSNDDGKTWALLGGNPTSFYHGGGVAYSPILGKWSFEMGYNVSTGHADVLLSPSGLCYFAAQEVKYLPGGNLGTIDYVAGTGEITGGYAPESSVVARFYLADKNTTEVAIHTAGADPISLDTFKIRARKLSALSVMEISETGGVLVGDGTGTLKKDAGYAVVEFSEPYATDTIEADYGYQMIGSPQPSAEHDGINTAALPVTGLVPAVQEGDTIIISDGVNQDSSVVMEVNKDQLIISTQLTHAYAAGSLVSNAVVFGDLQADKGVDFTQATWNSTWLDTQQGGPALGTYDFTNNPLGMTNKGSASDRWRITITQVVDVDHYEATVEGQLEGIIGTGVELGAYTAGSYAPINPATGSAYFSLDNAGWSSGWQVGNTLRFNTIAAGAPVWVARVINAKSSDSIDDQATLEIRGDIV